MDKKHVASVWYFLAAFLILTALQDYVFAPHVETLSYGEFKTLVEKGKVSDLAIGAKFITGRLKRDGLEGLLPKARIEALTKSGTGEQQFMTVKVDDPTLVQDLRQANVNFRGEVTSTWLPTLLSWLLPMGLFFLIMAATNRPEILDPALLRPGRFDRQVLVDRPDLKGREAILRVHAKGVTVAQEVELAIIAAKTFGFVGADLANIVNEAALLAARQGKEAVGMADFDEAIDRVVAGLKKTRVMSAKEREIVATHEAGHAVAAEFLPGADPVSKISIVSRGIAALGYTQQLPTEDRYLMTRSELFNRLCVLLGGRTAEEIIFGDVSTGAQNDLQRATDLVRHMVAQYGMSEKIGLMTFDGGGQTGLLPGLPRPREHSEDTARLIDAEASRILVEAHVKVSALLTEKRSLLEELARRLLEKEVVERDELQALLAGVKPS